MTVKDGIGVDSSGTFYPRQVDGNWSFELMIIQCTRFCWKMSVHDTSRSEVQSVVDTGRPSLANWTHK